MDKTSIGRNLERFSPGIEVQPITKVELLDERGEVVAVSGSDTGRTLTALHPEGTTEMAASILSKVSGYKHMGYDGRKALIDPAAELGDGVEVDGYYVPLIYADTTFDALFASDISAPDADEIDDEYPYKSHAQRQIERNFAQTRSLITKTSEEIKLKVEGIDGRVTALSTSIDGVNVKVSNLDGAMSNIKVDVNSIRSQVGGKIDGETAKSMIDQSISGIKMSARSGSDGTTFELMSGGAVLSTSTFDLHVKSVNIDGTLTAQELQGNQVALKDGVGRIVGGIALSYTTTGVGLGLLTSQGGIQIQSAGNLFLSAGTGGSITMQSGRVQIGAAALCLATASYGYSAPSGAGVAGQIYVQLRQ